jgi:Zn-dependent protease
VSAVLFNSIPLPPFDGYNVLEPFLNPMIREQMARFANIAIWVILLMFWFVPAVSNSFWETVFTVSTLLGVDWGWVIAGLERFRFWEL